MFKRTRPAATLASPSTAFNAPPDRLTIAWLVAALIMVVLPHLPRLPLWYLPLLLIASAERLSRFVTARNGPPAFVRVGIVIACVAALYLQNGALIGRGPGTALLCVMLALKLMECHQRRDVYLLVSLAYFVVVTQFLFSQSITMLIYLAATVVVITGVLLIQELQPSRQENESKTQRLDTTPIVPQLKTAGWLLLQCLPLMLVLFLFFPRLAEPLWGNVEDSAFGRTGISGEMSPGQIGQLFLDDKPAMRVRFDGPVPPRDQWYWRGPVLWNYDGETWTRPIRMLRTAINVPALAQQSSSALRYEITLEPSSRNWLFGLDLPLVTPEDGGMQRDHTLYRLRPVTQVHRYPMVSDPQYVSEPVLDGRARQAALALPPGSNPRARQLARRWLAQNAGDPAGVADQAMSYFRNEEFFYTFEPAPLIGERMDDFLFNTRQGYCEFYSSAFVVLMRSAGIPARVVTGYQGGFYNPNGNYILVRNSDAHAWSEIWLEGRGWVRYDPTAAVAPDRVDLGAVAAIGGSRGILDYGWVRSLKNRIDTIHSLWNDWIVRFNDARQRSLLSPFGIDNLDQRYLIALMIAAVAPFIAFMMTWLLRQQRLAARRPLDRLYHRFCALLKRRGINKLPHEGPRHFAERAGTEAPQLADWINAVTSCYIDGTYKADHHDVEQQMKVLLRNPGRALS